MTKQECVECERKIHLLDKLCPWRSISNDYCDKVESASVAPVKKEGESNTK